MPSLLEAIKASPGEAIVIVIVMSIIILFIILFIGLHFGLKQREKKDPTISYGI